jgi:hypothetical protein
MNLLEEFPDVFSDAVDSKFLALIDDIVTALFKSNPSRFLKTSLVPVNGADHSLVTFEINTIMLDAEVRAALRARGFEIFGGDGSHLYSP